jgi:folylpolyglutamate synthase/dihydropteroate synthase
MEAPLSKEILQGLATCRWPGRNEIVDIDAATFYLDGAQ